MMNQHSAGPRDCQDDSVAYGASQVGRKAAHSEDRVEQSGPGPEEEEDPGGVEIPSSFPIEAPGCTLRPGQEVDI